VIMTRESDITPGGNELRESLEYIAGLPKNKNADLFISIHTNATENGVDGKIQTSKSGFQIYIPVSSSGVYETSLKFGSVMTEVIKSDYAIEPDLKQMQGNGGNIYILKSATVPALLIECGYMDNPSDLKYLQDEKSQEKIARDILEGIRKFSLLSATTWYTPRNQTDTLSYVEYEKIDPKMISGVEMNSNNDYLIVYFTDGKKAFVKITNAIREKWAVDLKNNQASPVFTKVEVEAKFPGGPQGWYDYLVKNLKYPTVAVSNEIQGEVIVEFIVKKNGALSGIHALSGPEELRMESVRILQESGKWIPAKNNGDIVESYRMQPINYKLESK
jgi:N-acetylmuramoyl-L-alanine amidase/Gram-negative bacterial TonB protein C-terminal